MYQSIKKSLIFLLCFSIIAIGTTRILIEKNNKSKEIIQEQKNEEITQVNSSNIIEISKKVETFNRYGTYNENSLKILNIKKTIKNVDCYYISIEGLKNKEIENNINKKIKSTIVDILNLNKNIEYCNLNVSGNFSNILSLVGFYSYYDENENYLSDNFCLNFDLTTGKEIIFEDLFIEDIDLLEILRDGVYKEFVLNSLWIMDIDKYMEEEGIDKFDEYYVAIDYLEGEVIQKIKRFMNSDNRKFYITPGTINFSIDEYYYSIDSIKFADKIIIYNKYLTEESIYEDNSIGIKNIINGTYVFSDNFYLYETNFIDDNLFYNSYIKDESYILEEDISKNTLDFKDDLNTYMKEKETLVLENIEKYKKIAKEDKENFYILLEKVILKPITLSEEFINNEGENIYINRYSPIIKENDYLYVYKIPLDLYEGKYKDILFESSRKENYDDYNGYGIYIEKQNDFLYNEIKKDYYYDIENNIEVYDVCKNIFNNNVNYEEVLASTISKIILERQYISKSEEELEEILFEMIQNKEFIIDLYGISINFILDGQEIFEYIALEQIPLSFYKLY